MSLDVRVKVTGYLTLVESLIAPPILLDGALTTYGLRLIDMHSIDDLEDLTLEVEKP